MSVRLRLGPLSLSSRGRVGVRLGPVSAYGGGHRRKRRTATTQTRRGPSAAVFEQRDPVRLKAWLQTPQPPLVLPGRFTQTWFTENAARIHPGQVKSLVDELTSRGWSHEDIARRAVPHLTRAAADREVLLERHRLAEERTAARRKIREERKDSRRARWRSFFSKSAS